MMNYTIKKWMRKLYQIFNSADIFSWLWCDATFCEYSILSKTPSLLYGQKWAFGGGSQRADFTGVTWDQTIGHTGHQY